MSREYSLCNLTYENNNQLLRESDAAAFDG